MIYLATDNPSFEANGEQTLVIFPSGKGNNVTIALTRNQLCYLVSRGRIAMQEAFAEPQPEIAGPILMRGREGGRANG
jgi:hypothetical protein